MALFNYLEPLFSISLERRHLINVILFSTLFQSENFSHRAVEIVEFDIFLITIQYSK